MAIESRSPRKPRNAPDLVKSRSVSPTSTQRSCTTGKNDKSRQWNPSTKVDMEKPRKNIKALHERYVSQHLTREEGEDPARVSPRRSRSGISAHRRTVSSPVLTSSVRSSRSCPSFEIARPDEQFQVCIGSCAPGNPGFSSEAKGFVSRISHPGKHRGKCSSSKLSCSSYSYIHIFIFMSIFIYSHIHIHNISRFKIISKTSSRFSRLKSNGVRMSWMNFAVDSSDS